MVRFLLPIFVMAMPVVAQAKYTVCTATINSSEEAQVFKSKLNSADFEFVELTGFSSDAGAKKDDWMDNACKAGVKCDVLVVSGHFGGEFFGSSGFRLGLKNLNHYSCYKRCDGIMSHPKEVYLFGCNTLATKDKDRRTQAQYVEVLVADQIDRTEAERRAAARYGPFGQSFRDQIERSFENVPLIYGFTSVGPAGKNVKAALTDYLTRIGDYKRHLDAITYAKRDNPAFMTSLGRFPIAIGKGLSPSNPVYQIKENSCAFTNEEKPAQDRLELAIEVLGRDPYVYMPTVSSFVNAQFGSHRWHGSRSDDAQTERAFARVASRADLAKLILDNARSSSVTPGIRVDLLKTARNLRWLGEEDFAADMHKLLDPIVERPSASNADLVCSLLSEDNSVQKYIRADLIAAYKFETAAEFRVLDCVNLEDKNLQEAVYQGLVRNRAKWKGAIEIATVLGAANNTVRGHSAEMLEFSRSFLNYRGQYEKEIREFIRGIMVSRAVGAEQVGLVRAGLKAGTTAALAQTANGLGNNAAIEADSTIAVLENMTKFRPAELQQVYLGGKGLFGGHLAVEEWLATHWDGLSKAFKNRLDSSFLEMKQIRSAPLRKKILEDLSRVVGADQDMNNYVNYPSFLSPFGKSQLGEDEIDMITKLIAQKDVDQGFNLSPSLRQVLYEQAKAGRIEMTAAIRDGYRLRYHCEKTSSRGLSCASDHNPE